MDANGRRRDFRKIAGYAVGSSQLIMGALLLAAPDAVGRPFGIGAEPWARWFGRLYGIRDVGTGVGLINAARGGPGHKEWFWMEAAIQSVDAIASFSAWRSKAISARTALPVMAIAPVWVGLCIAAATQRDDPA